MRSPGPEKEKIPNTNTRMNIEQKRHRSLTKATKKQYLDYVAQPTIDKLIREMNGWAYEQLKQDKPIFKTIQSFLNSKKIPYNTFADWCKEYPALEKAKRNARAVLSELHQHVAIHTHCNAQPIVMILPVYSAEVMEAKQIEAELKAKAAAPQQSNIVVGIPTYQYDVTPSQQQAVIPVDDKKQE
jgi:hypothetical protein